MPATPLSYWIGFHVVLLLLLAVEFFYARRRRLRGCNPHRTAVAATCFWIAAALAFSIFLRHTLGPTGSVQYLAGYVLEESMSVDNLFVFLLLFQLFQIEQSRQPRVLFWGIAGAMLMRGLFILGGISLLNHFEAVSYVFGVIILIGAIRLLSSPGKSQPAATPRWIAALKRFHPVSLRQDHFVVLENGRPTATMLLLALVAIELTDLIFALDSIPAVLSITRHPFLAYTSNIMAVIGLRSLYFLLIGMLTRLRFLHYGLAAILAFAAFKMLAAHWIEIGPALSLGIILALLAITISASLWAPAAKVS